MKILVVVDVQNDFVGGALGSSRACAIASNITKKVQHYFKCGNGIVFTQDVHSNEYLFSIEGQFVPEHCVYGDQNNGWQLIKPLDDFIKDNKSDRIKIVHKSTFTGFDLDNRIAQIANPNDPSIARPAEPIDSIEIVGLCTDICVVSNALYLRSAFPNVPIIVDATCCAGTTPEKHEAALSVMESNLIFVRR